MNIILLHGFCESKEIWKDFAPLLQNEFKVYCLDLLGFGTNTTNDTNYSLHQITKDIHQQIENLKLNNYYIIGHSLGGYVALDYAKLYPNKLNGIGLFHSTPFADTPEKKENRTKSIQFVEKYGVPAFIKSFVPSLFYEKHIINFQSEINLIMNVGLQTSLASFITTTKIMRERPSSIDFILETNLPVLIIIGAEDTFFNFDDNFQIFNQIKNKKIVVLEKVAHLGMFESTENCIKAIKSYVYWTNKNFIKNNI